MRLDLLIATLGRPALLRRALDSLARAARPATLDVVVCVINNATDPALPELDAVGASLPYPLHVIHEPRPGKSAALNSGIRASSADYIGVIDDDEEVAPDWFLVVENALQRGDIDFLGGRSLPAPGAAIPSWAPRGYAAVLGLADAGVPEMPYGPDFPGVLMGGNVVMSRAILEKVGPYNTELGPRQDRRLFSCEDEDMYVRLLEAGARGRYLPGLIVHHHLHPERLRKSYYRAWCFWNAASKGVLSRRHRSPLPQILGVPRYMYGDAVRGVIRWARTVLAGGSAATRLAAELPLWQLAGQLYGTRMRGTSPKAPPRAPTPGGHPLPTL